MSDSEVTAPPRLKKRLEIAKRNIEMPDASMTTGPHRVIWRVSWLIGLCVKVMLTLWYGVLVIAAWAYTVWYP